MKGNSLQGAQPLVFLSRMQNAPVFKGCSSSSFIFLAGLRLHCRVGAFSSCGDGGSSLLVVLGLLTAVACLVAGHEVFRSSGSWAQYLWYPEIRCSMASWIFLDQRSNACSSAFPRGYFTTEPPGKPPSPAF